MQNNFETKEKIPQIEKSIDPDEYQPPYVSPEQIVNGFLDTLSTEVALRKCGNDLGSLSKTREGDFSSQRARVLLAQFHQTASQLPNYPTNSGIAHHNQGILTDVEALSNMKKSTTYMVALETQVATL